MTIVRFDAIAALRPGEAFNYDAKTGALKFHNPEVVAPTAEEIDAKLLEMQRARLVRKSIIVARLHAAGLLTAASQALNADLYTRERWYAPDQPAVYANNPESQHPPGKCVPPL